MKAFAAVLLTLAVPAAATAQPLTIRLGESWAFAVEHGQPARAHKVKLDARPAPGEVKATLTGLAGTTMTLTNNGRVGYRYRAQLLGVPGKPATRTCQLPPNLKLSLEYWPQKAAAVRLSDFQATDASGNCPPGR